jgi:bifunctional UDP-N-acetylglucosamine pyrophosphorylase / glucosamine-1-phosphate N-acetyltransferase
MIRKKRAPHLMRGGNRFSEKIMLQLGVPLGNREVMQVATGLAVILAAGEGTRMRSALPKVLHGLGGRPLIGHVLSAVAQTGSAVAAVVGPGHDAVAAVVRKARPGAAIFVQSERRGTAHAVLAARAALEDAKGPVLVVFGDTPLVTATTLTRLRDALGGGTAVAVLGFRPADPFGYGRLVVEDGELVAIREEKDASAAERALTLCNAGAMALDGEIALAILDQIGDHNAKREFYLTDAVAIARAMGRKVVAIETEEDEVRGINTRAQLAEAEAVLQRRLRQHWLEAGVTMVAPETVFLSADTQLAPDVVIEPNVVFGEGVVVEEGAVIRSFSHLEGAHVGKGARVGPFARLRPGADLGPDVHIGNFVEVKAAEMGRGAKANHLAYIGDARVGEGANVGAGTITCNYDGTAKHRTEIGKGAFIGSNSALVAPVSIGDRAYVGSGSVITSDVPADALAIGRGRQVVKEGWAARLRGSKTQGKKKPEHAAD